MLVGCRWYKLWYIAFRTFGVGNFYFLKEFLKCWISFVVISFGKEIAMQEEEQKWDGKMCVSPRLREDWDLKIFWVGTELVWFNTFSRSLPKLEQYGLHGFMLIYWKRGIYDRSQLHRTVVGIGGSYSNLEVWSGNLWRYRMGWKYGNWQELNVP